MTVWDSQGPHIVQSFHFTRLYSACDVCHASWCKLPRKSLEMGEVFCLNKVCKCFWIFGQKQRMEGLSAYQPQSVLQSVCFTVWGEWPVLLLVHQNSLDISRSASQARKMGTSCRCWVLWVLPWIFIKQQFGCPFNMVLILKKCSWHLKTCQCELRNQKVRQLFNFWLLQL